MDRFKEMEETHCIGRISIETIPQSFLKASDLGIQISKSGKVWICINGIAFLRFTPQLK